MGRTSVKAFLGLSTLVIVLILSLVLPASSHDVYMGVFTPAYDYLGNPVDANMVSWQGKNFAAEKTYIDVTTGTSSLTYSLLETIWQKGRVPELVATFTLLKVSPCGKTLVHIDNNLSNPSSEDYIGLMNIAQGLKNWLNLGQYRFTLLTFIHEPNWSNCGGGDYSSYTAFKSAFIKARGIVDGKLGVDAERIQWVFNPNNVSNDGIPAFEYFYPGNDYVDWVGLSAYNWGGYVLNGWTFPWVMFDNFKVDYFDRVSAFAERKPLMLAEYASIWLDWSYDKDAWIKDFLQKSTQYPGLCLLQYFNWNTPGESFPPGFDFPVYWEIPYDARPYGYDAHYTSIRQQGWLDAINNSTYMNSLKFSPCTIAGVCTDNVNINNFDLFPELRNREFDTICGVPPCTYSISPLSKDFTYTGGTGSISVDTQSGCKWTASESLDWVSISSGSSGKDNGTVNYNVGINPTGSSRSGNISVAGKTFQINQGPSNVYNFVNGYTTPSQVSPGGTYTIGCNYGQVLDCIYVVPGQSGSSCVFSGNNGTTAQFQCSAGSQTGTFNNTCGLFAGTANGCAERSGDPAGSLTVPSYTIQTSAGSDGSISPAGPVTAYYGQTYNFTITPNNLYSIKSVTGCSGTLTGNTYTTGPITGDCTVTAVFNPFFEGGSTTPSAVNAGDKYKILCDYGRRMDCIYPIAGQTGSQCFFVGFNGTAARFQCTAGSGTGTFNNFCGLFTGTGDNCPARTTDPAGTLTVEAVTMTYTLSNSGNITVEQGASGSNTITASYVSGTAQQVSFSISGMPAGASYSFSQGSCTPECTTNLTITTTSATLAGTYPITVIATPGGQTTQFNLIVNLAADFDFVAGSTIPSQVNAGGKYKIRCDYGQRLDCIDAAPGQTGSSCFFAGFVGTAAQFQCTAGSETGVFDNTCRLFSGTSSNCPARTGDPAGSLTVQ